MSDVSKPSSGIRVGHVNVYHLGNKLHDIFSLLSGPPRLHILGISETRLNLQSNSELSIPNYTFFRKDASRSPQTGLGIYVHNDVLPYATRRPDLETDGVESMWVQLKRSAKDSTILICILYRNPSYNYAWYDDFVHMMDLVTAANPKSDYIILGDFNIDLLKPHTSWKSTCNLFGLQQLVQQPTRVTPTSSTLLDHIYTNNVDRVYNVHLSDVSLSDHSPIVCTLSWRPVKRTKGEHTTIEYRSAKNFNQTSFLYDLRHVNFSSVHSCDNPNDALSVWQSLFMPIIDKHAPIRRRRVKQRAQPGWITADIMEAMKIRDSLKKAKKFDEYKSQRNKVSVLIKNSKRKYVEQMISNNCDTAHLWRAMNEITRKKRKPSLSATASPDTLNEHFLSAASLLHQSNPSTPQDYEYSDPLLADFCSDRLQPNDQSHIPELAAHEVGKYISELKNKKSVGVDTISTYILKLSLPYVVESLTFLYNLCIKTCVIPERWKCAKVIPIPKTSDVSDINNFRPISILSVLSKPLEKHIHKHLVHHMESHDLFYQYQSGFRKFHSCSTALVYLCNTWLSAINESKIVGAVFLDLRKAFETVDHNLLISKLNYYTRNSQTVKLLASFITNRTQRVYVNGKYSPDGALNLGVPQGSILGPLLFGIFINDLPLHITNKNVSCELFADDSSLHSSSKTLNKVQSDLQHGINDVAKWCNQNKMTLHPKKSNSMVITSRQKHQRAPLLLDLSLNADPIDQVTSHTVLGIIVDQELRWDVHLKNMCSKLSNDLHLLSKLKPFVDAEGLKMFYVAHCFSKINYASTVWSGASENQIQKVNSLHRRGAKLIIKDPYLSTDDKLKKANILPLQKQFDFNNSMLMYKTLHGLAPPYLSALLYKAPERYGSNRYLLPSTRIDMCKARFAFVGPLMWNSLPSNVKNSKTVTIFKCSLKKHLN